MRSPNAAKAKQACVVVATAIAIACSARLCATVASSAPPHSVAEAHAVGNVRPPDQFTSVNGVRLHFLDWGGHGPALVFLSGLGDDVHRFDALAPKFTDRYRALGFTRRGQESSEKPATGYDLP